MAKHHCSRDCGTHNKETLEEALLGLSNEGISRVEHLLLTIKNEQDANTSFIKALTRELEGILQDIDNNRIKYARKTLKGVIQLLS